MNNIVLILGVSLLFLASCNQSGTKQSAESGKLLKVADGQIGEEVIACFHASKVYWKGSKPTGEHNGIVKLAKGGKYIVEDDKLIGGEFVIDMTTIVDIDIEDEEMNNKLVSHLKSPDFFHVDSFPTAKFVIAEVLPLKDDEAYNTTIKGNLTIKGITHPLNFKAKVKIGDGKVTALSEDIIIDRTKYGIEYKSKSIFKEIKDNFIDDEFVIRLEMHSM